jgi:hypothetical protein
VPRELGKAEICQFQQVIGEKDEVVRLDVAMNDALFMSMGDGRQDLAA